MKIRDHFIFLFVAGSLISVITYSLSELTNQWMNGNPDGFNIKLPDVWYIFFSGIAFAVFMKRIKKSIETPKL